MNKYQEAFLVGFNKQAELYKEAVPWIRRALSLSNPEQAVRKGLYSSAKNKSQLGEKTMRNLSTFTQDAGINAKAREMALMNFVNPEKYKMPFADRSSEKAQLVLGARKPGNIAEQVRTIEANNKNFDNPFRDSMTMEDKFRDLHSRLFRE